MSQDWDVYCPQCDDRLGLLDANHEQALVFRLIAARDGLCALATSVENSEMCIEVKADHYYRFDPGFFRDHEGHPLVAKSEYGDILESLEDWKRQQTP